MGATHLGIIVDDLEALYQDLSAKGVKFLCPPVDRPERIYGRKVSYLQDPDGNWLEFLQGAPVFQFA